MNDKVGQYLWYSMIAVYVVFAALQVTAMEYDVDMPPHSDHKVDVIRITVDGCDTLINVKKEELILIEKSPENIKMLVDAAIKHKQSGCK